LCTGNHAQGGGRFAVISGNAGLQFNDPATANVDNNTINDILIYPAKFEDTTRETPRAVTVVPQVACGATGNASSNNTWREGAYRISGPVCAYNRAFAAGESQECLGTCKLGFESMRCRCSLPVSVI
jgi:hypothetical protein